MNNEAFAEAMEQAAENQPTAESTPDISDIVIPEQTQEAPTEQAIQTTPETAPVTEEVTTPVTEQPVAEQPKTVEVEKVVEKIIEKHPEFKSEKAKQLFEQLTTAEDPKEAEKTVFEYLREKSRDYNTMSDADVIKAALRKENPTWTKDDVELKMRRTYGKDLTTIDLTTIDKDLEPEKYEKAEQHNEDVANALSDMRLDALQKRPMLIQYQQELELPKITQTQEAAPSGPTPEQMEEANRAWAQAVDGALPTLSEIKQTIDDKEVVYALNEDDKKALKTQMDTFNLIDFSKQRGWQNEDGTPNVLKLAEDVLKLQNFDKISKSYATQIKTDTIKDTLKSIKNVDTVNSPPQEASVGSFEEAYFASLTK